jgi:hypothetical protein
MLTYVFINILPPWKLQGLFAFSEPYHRCHGKRSTAYDCSVCNAKTKMSILNYFKYFKFVFKVEVGDKQVQLRLCLASRLLQAVCSVTTLVSL